MTTKIDEVRTAIFEATKRNERVNEKIRTIVYEQQPNGHWRLSAIVDKWFMDKVYPYDKDFATKVFLHETRSTADFLEECGHPAYLGEDH